MKWISAFAFSAMLLARPGVASADYGLYADGQADQANQGRLKPAPTQFCSALVG